MSEANPSTREPAATPQSRRWLFAGFYLVWTALAALAIAWLIGDADSSKNTVIRVGPDEMKTWAVRLHETMALARLNFPWAVAWIFLAPYVVWVGARFSFGGVRWWTRLPVLLAAGAGFIASSQWLSHRLGAGQAMFVMVNYSTDMDVEKTRAPVDGFDEPLPREFITNRIVTNRVARIVMTGEAAHPTNHASWEIATREILSGLATNIPQLLGGGVPGGLPPPGSLRTGRWSAALDGLAYLALIGLAHAGVFHRRYREREKQAVVLESRLNQARLRALQAQLQPHFLFNTLNGIATLLRRDPAAAEEMLLSLSELLRIALGSADRQEISLREEMEFLGRYLAIQRMRFGDRLQVHEDIDPRALECLVPALLLQPLVENAIHHGFEPSGKPGTVRIAAAREGDWLMLTVEDNGVGLSSKRGHSTGTGVGLANVRERLAALHGTAHEFRLEPRAQGGAEVTIRLPARTAVEVADLEEACPA